VRNSC